MSDTLTTVLQFNKPEVGASAGTWGTKLNNNADGFEILATLPAPLRKAATTAGASTTLSAAQALVHKLTVDQNTQIGFTGWRADNSQIYSGVASALIPGQRLWLLLIDGDDFTTTWSGVTWLSGVAPTLGPASLLEFFTLDNGTTIYGVHHGVQDDATIVAAMIAADAVTTAKILDENVTTAKLADAAVTAPKVAGTYPRRVKIHLAVDGSLPANTATEIAWGASPTEDYNVGSFITSTNGVKVPASDTDDRLLVLTAQLALGLTGDPSSDNNTVCRIWIEDGSGNILAETWEDQDAQNGSTNGHRMQVTARINDPDSAAVYRVKAQSYPGAGTRTILATKTWLAAEIY